MWYNIFVPVRTHKIMVRPVGQAAKTSPSQGENMGSIPVRVTKTPDASHPEFFSEEVRVKSEKVNLLGKRGARWQNR